MRPWPLAPKEWLEVGATRLTKAFVGFVCVVILGADAWIVLRERVQQLRQIELANSNLAQAVAQQMESVFGETQNLLGSIAFSIDQYELADQDLGVLQPILVHSVTQVRQLSDLFILDATGRLVVHTRASTPQHLSTGSQDFFVRHRDSVGDSIYIGSPYRGADDGQWLIPVSKRLNDPFGNFAGVVLATLSVVQLTSLLDSYEIGKNGAMALINNKGIVLLRRPFHAEALGSSVAGAAISAGVVARAQGTIEAASPVDGERRIASFQRSRQQPLYVAVGLSTDEALAPWRRTAAIQTAWASVLCLIVACAGAFLVKVVRRKAQAEADSRNARIALEDANRKLEHLSRHDALTGLANRRFLDHELAQALAAHGDQRSISLLMIDVDHFKAYNDAYGHPVGDECLIRIASVVQQVTEQVHGFAARFGGEEMAVLLPHTVSPLEVAERIRLAVEFLPFIHPSAETDGMTVSVGVSTSFPGQSPAQLVAEADSALYAAKRAGRNRVIASGAIAAGREPMTHAPTEHDASGNSGPDSTPPLPL